MANKYRKSTSRGLKKKIKGVNSSVQTNLKNIKDKVLTKKIYLKGQEPPKSYAFEKKFFGLYFIFIFYSFLFLWGINDPNNILIKYLAFGDPFSFGNALLAFFLTLSIFINIEKIRHFIFGKLSILKQIVIFGLVFIGYYYLFFIIGYSINFITYFLVLSFIWIIILSSRFYIYSRKFSTRIEYRFIKKYSPSRYFIALIFPIIIAISLIFSSLFYRTFLVLLSLDFFPDSSASDAHAVFDLEMRVIMPLIYFSLVMTIIFIILEFMSTRIKAETRRAGTFDNFTFSLIIFFIFFFQIFQMSVFLFLQPETLAAIKSTVGANNNTAITYIFIFEYMISMIFLYRVILKLGKSYGWQFLFFKRDGLILFFLGCVLAQTLARFALTNDIKNQEITILGNVFLADKYIISILMISFLGITLLVYYIKPHQTSMFVRMQKETVNKEDESTKVVYKLIRNEYIRRGEAFPLEILERELIKATKLSKATLYSLIKRLADKDFNITLNEMSDDYGNKGIWIDFISITERFEKKEKAEKKAKKYLAEELVKTTSKKVKDLSKLGKNLKSGKASDQFIASLTSTYDKKQIHKQERAEKLSKLKDIPFKSELLDIRSKKKIIKILKMEYKYRIENRSDYPEIYIPISDIAKVIKSKTRISLGAITPILMSLSLIDLELTLVDNQDNPDDKKILIIPYFDFEMNELLSKFRPEEYQIVKKSITNNFLMHLKEQNHEEILTTLYDEIRISKKKSIEWEGFLECLNHNYKNYDKQLPLSANIEKLHKAIKNIKKAKENRKNIDPSIE